jgi:hypothetical protein
MVPDGCLSLADDGFDPNDDCAGAVLLAPGTFAANYVHEADPDFFAVDVAPGDRLTVDVLYTATAGPLDVVLYSDLGCALAVDSASASGGDQVRYSNTGTTTVRCIVAIRVPAWTMQDCNNYDLNVTVMPEPCLLAADDSFEENDSCGNAVPLSQGSHLGLFVNGVDQDYYRVSVPANDRLVVDIFYGTPAASALSLALYDDATCTNLVDFQSWTGADRVTFANAGSTTADWTVVVSAADSVASECNSYDMTVAISPDPCLTATDDAFEDNDDCSSATPLVEGDLNGLFASFDDNDYFTFDLIPNAAVLIELDHLATAGDLDLLLFDIGPGCGAQFFEVASATGTANLELLAYKNTSSSVVTYVLQVSTWAVGDCNNYDLKTTFTDNQVGTPTCLGDGSFDPGAGVTVCPCSNLSASGSGEGCLNSTGTAALLEVRGTSLFANDDMVFELSRARPNQPSMLVQGTSLVGIPFKDGILCAGSPTERVEVVMLDATGSGSTSGSIATQGAIPGPGATRYYQQWYRDPGGVSPCGTGSNFSNGLIVIWN